MEFLEIIDRQQEEKEKFVLQIYKEYCLQKGLNIKKLAKKRKRFKREIRQGNIEVYFYKKTPIFKLQCQVVSGNDNSFDIVYNYEKLF